MDKGRFFNVVFVAGCAALFLLACALTAWGMIKITIWHLLNCATTAPACVATDALISYWWVVFVPTIVLVAVLLHRWHQRLLPTTKL